MPSVQSVQHRYLLHVILWCHYVFALRHQSVVRLGPLNGASNTRTTLRQLPRHLLTTHSGGIFWFTQTWWNSYIWNSTSHCVKLSKHLPLHTPPPTPPVISAPPRALSTSRICPSWLSTPTLPWQCWKSKIQALPQVTGFSPKRANSLGQSAPNLCSDSQLFHGTIRLARAITWHSLWAWL